MITESTKKYLEENKYIYTLERSILKSENIIKYNYESILWAIKYKLKELTNLKQYKQEKKMGGKWLNQLKELKGSKRNSIALVLGNGPSQGFISKEILNKLIQKDNDIFVVNHWNQNKNLSSIVPRYLTISDPATLLIDEHSEHYLNNSLAKYIAEHSGLKIICPVSRCDEIGKRFGEDRVIGFIDSELRQWTSNLSPLKPRGYVSMTLYKALAMAIWFGYKKIFILGMDNTYPRNTFCDEKNRILNLEIHAGGMDFIADHGDRYRGMGDLMIDLSHLFYDAQKFSKVKNITNLDPYSLTDAFPKVNDLNIENILNEYLK